MRAACALLLAYWAAAVRHEVLLTPLLHHAVRACTAAILTLSLACTGAPVQDTSPPDAAPPQAPPAVPVTMPMDAPAQEEGPALPGDPPPVVAPADAPDIVLVTLDTTRADHLGLYGYHRDTSPALDALGAQAVVFDRFIVPMATTLPTHTSLLTGVWPHEHGILANVMHGGERFVPTDSLVSLAQVLDQQGYATGAFVSAAPLRASSGVLAGFQTHTEPLPDKVERRAEKTNDDALRYWSGLPADQPALLWVHYYDPHNPFKAPTTYARQFLADDGAVDAWMNERKVSRSTRRPTGQVVRAKPSINGYDAEIRYMDDQLLRLIDGVKARGRWDNTILIIAGDHGEGLNQHGQPGHGLVWNEQLHAPLLILAPGLAPRRVAHIASAPDVLPTLLGLTDLPGAEALAQQTTGRDLLSDTPPPADRAVLSQTSARQLAFNRPMTYALTSATSKCVGALTDGVAQATDAAIYDLAADPFELAPVTEGPAVQACATQLAAVVADQQQRGAALGAGETAPVDAARLEELRALGYLDDDAAPAEVP